MTDLSAPAVEITYDETTMQRLPVDVEHTGIRVVVPALAFGTLLLVLWGGPVLLNLLNLSDTFLRGVLLPLAIIGAIVVAFASDTLLKQKWTSGRELLVDDRYLIFRERKQPDHIILWTERINVLAWRFTVARRGRVPKGHYCLAVQLLQDDRQITAYTFYDPKHFDQLLAGDAFTPLAPRSSLDDERLNLRVAGQQRRLFQAENERWREGAELTSDHFVELWQIVQGQQKATQE
ncbi:hypothetical protein ACFLYO_03930 [Chloroflexota bacterium]